MTLFTSGASAHEYPNLVSASKALPALPKVLRYEDDYADVIRSVDTSDNTWRIHVDGGTSYADWGALPSEAKRLMQFWLIWIANTYDATSLLKLSSFISRRSADIGDMLEQFLTSPPVANEYWHSTVITSDWSLADIVICKTILRCLCLNLLGPWSPVYFDSIRQWPLGVRKAKQNSSDVLEKTLSHQEEARLLNYFDGISSSVSLEGFVDDVNLRTVCILICCYQFGVRPIQIASLDTADVKFRILGRSNNPSIHIRFSQAKQRRGDARESMLRKVKDAWARIFQRYINQRLRDPSVFVTEIERPNSFFGLAPSKISELVVETSKQIIGIKASANVYRHTAAQRLVDSGASEIELAEFLGHSDMSSGLVYFDGAPAQAARINAALGLSPIYSKVSGVLSGAISLAEYNLLSDEMKVAAAPHGILIAGIGGCNIGQPSCSKNPALSCYTCSKFMPLRDAKVHKEVRDELRPVISEFHNASRGSKLSPTFMQLRSTMEAIEEVIAGLGGEDDA